MPNALRRLVAIDQDLGSRRTVMVPVLTALCLALAMLALTHHSARPLLNADSMGYVEFDAFRPYGYPVVVNLIKDLFGSLEDVVPVQVLVFHGALLALALSFGRLSRSLVLSGTLVLASAANAGLFNSFYSIQVESVAAALMMLAAACFLGFLRRGRTRDLLGYGLFVGLSLTVRPISLVLVPVTLVLLGLFWSPAFHRRGIAAAGALLIMAGCLLSVAMFNQQRHGFFGLNGNAGIGLYGKAMFLALDATPAPEDFAAPEIRRPLEAASGLLSRVTDFHSYLVLLQRYNVYLRFHVIFPQLAQRHGLDSQRRLDQYAMAQALPILAAHPGGFAGTVLEQLYHLIVDPDLMTRREAARFTAITAALAPLPLPNAAIDFAALPQRLGDLITIGYRLFCVTVVALGLSVLGLVLLMRLRGRKPSALLQGATLAALTIAALYLGTAIGDVAVARYTYPVWPISVLLLAMVAAEARDRLSRGAPPASDPIGCGQITAPSRKAT